LTVRGGSTNAAATDFGLSVIPVTLKWRAAMLFGGQLILVGGGVLALLLIQQVRYGAGATAEGARRAQVQEAHYFAAMTEAASSRQEYLRDDDIVNLGYYNDATATATSAESALRNLKVDPTERALLDKMFTAADGWHLYARRALLPAQVGVLPADGSEAFFSFRSAELASSTYLEMVSASAAADMAEASRRELIALTSIASIALVSVIAGGILMYRSTLRPMGRLILTARALAAGARTELPPSSSRGEVGDLSRALHAWQRFSEKRASVIQAMHAVSGRVDRDEIVRMSLERLFEVADADVVAAILSDDAGSVITIMTRAGGLQEPMILPPGSPFDGLFRTSASLVDDSSDESWPEEIREWAREGGYGPMAVVPMASGSKAVGAVAATRSIGRPAFDVVDVSLIEAIAGPLAAAVRVAGLFDEVRAVSAQLDLVNRHKTDFLSNMSHELRTPLNSILGFADLLVTPGFDPVTTKQARYIANIRTSGAHLHSLINDALDLAKVESGKADLELERVDVRALVAEVVAAMQPLATAAKVELVTSPGRPGEITADRRKPHQVLLNLLSNAIKFTPPEGRVTIAMERAGGDLLLTVADTGIGVSGEDQERIFEAFEQVSGANRDGGGTGLGLALSRQLVELHGGRLWLESVVGRGSNFHVSLPLSGVAAHAA
jgi:signal transduction histidine kinase